MKNILHSPGCYLLPALLCGLPLVGGAAPFDGPGRPARVTLTRPQPAQTVTGRVTDDKGEGLPGVTVRVRNGTAGTTTNANGDFSLDAPEGATLIFSSVGFATKEVAVSGQSALTVSLATDSQQLSEAVVVGYLTQERQNVTGSVATLGAQDVRRAPVATISESIQGRLAGVQVTTSGAPGSTPNINIRGVGSIANGSGPLFIVDGLWITSGLRDFTPQDVESVQVLKDAASLAAYGASGANGVVIITTKKGRSNTTTINFNAYAGVQNIAKRYELANAADYSRLASEAYRNASLPVPAGVANPAPGIDTDWQKEFFKTGVVQNYNLGFLGGGPNSTYAISGDYFKQTGTVIGPEYERFNIRVNSSFTKGKLRVGENIALTRANQTRLNGVPFIDLLRMTPVTPVLDPANPGGFGYGNNNCPGFGSNPIGAQNLTKDLGNNNQLQGNIYGEFSFTSSLRYRLNLATQYRAFRDQVQQQAGGLAPNNIVPVSSYSDAQGNETFLMAENTLTYDHSFGLHNFTVVGGYSQQYNRFEFTQGRAQGYGNGPVFFWALDAGTTPLPGIGSSNTNAKISGFGQFTYDYDGRYLVTGAYRRDASSRFSPDRRNGDFGAGSVGWRVSKEKFFSGITAVSDLKLRASYGVLGNDQLNGPYGGSYLYQAFINPNVNYNFGGAVVNGAIQTRLSSPTVGWEERATQNYGLDISFLENRLTVSADYYVSNSRQNNVNPDIPLFTSNAGGDPFLQIGRIENKGFEMLVSYQEGRGPFTYGVSANLTTVRNTVLDLGAGTALLNAGPAAVTRTEPGYEVGSFYLYQFAGIFQNAGEITGSAQPNARPGDVRYLDLNGDGRITDADRAHSGRVFPRIQYGFNLTGGYGGFDVAVFFQGVQGNTVYNSGAYWLGRFDDQTNYRADLSPWRTDNPSTTTPRLSLAGGPNTFANSTRFLEDGSYLRLKNLQIGYTIPKDLVSKTRALSSLRLYVTSANLFTVTKYSGYDPETIGGLDGSLLTRGIDEGAFPNPRTFTAGIQMGF